MMIDPKSRRNKQTFHRLLSSIQATMTYAIQAPNIAMRHQREGLVIQQGLIETLTMRDGPAGSHCMSSILDLAAPT
jgi:hypothetical protein